MNPRHNPLYWSFGLGTWFGTRVRVSVFLPLCILVLAFRPTGLFGRSTVEKV